MFLISHIKVYTTGVARGSGMTMDVIVPLFSPLMTIGCSGNRLYWVMSDRYRINVMDLEGKEITSFSVDRKKTGVSKKDKWEYFKTDNLPADMLKQIVDSLPDEVTCFYRIDVHNTLIFIFVPEMDLENKTLRTRQIDIFSPEGKYIYKARLDFGKNRAHLFSPLQNMVIKSGFLYTVLQDEEDNVLAAKYKISLPTL